MTKLPVHKLYELLRYDPATGLFTWKTTGSGRRKSSLAGAKRTDGYIRLKVLDHRIPAHVAAYVFSYGFYPQAPLDHINGVRDDNRIANLRLSSVRENGQNRSSHRTGRLVGATFFGRRGKWRAQIKDTGVRNQRHLGYFDTEQEAHAAYLAAAMEKI